MTLYFPMNAANNLTWIFLVWYWFLCFLYRKSNLYSSHCILSYLFQKISTGFSSDKNYACFISTHYSRDFYTHYFRYFLCNLNQFHAKIKNFRIVIEVQKFWSSQYNITLIKRSITDERPLELNWSSLYNIAFPHWHCQT